MPQRQQSTVEKEIHMKTTSLVVHSLRWMMGDALELLLMKI